MFSDITIKLTLEHSTDATEEDLKRAIECRLYNGAILILYNAPEINKNAFKTCEGKIINIDIKRDKMKWHI